MNTENNNQGVSAREIPVPPGGGSWTWNGAEWVSNDPIPNNDPTTDAPVGQPAESGIVTNEE